VVLVMVVVVDGIVDGGVCGFEVSLRSSKRSGVEACLAGAFVSSCSAGAGGAACACCVLVRTLASSWARASRSNTTASPGIFSDSRMDNASS